MASTIPPNEQPCSSCEPTSHKALSTTLGGRKLKKQWENNLESLQSQIVSILGAVDKDRVDVSVGQTAIRNDQAVVLAWNKNQTLKQGFKLQEKVESDDDGVLLYLAIRYNRNGEKGSSDNDDDEKGLEKLSNGEEPLIQPRVHPSLGSSPPKELTHDENNNTDNNSGANLDSNQQSVPYSSHPIVSLVDLKTTPNAAEPSSASSSSNTSLPFLPPPVALSVSDEPGSGSEESFVHDFNSNSELQGSEEETKKKRKKSVHWRENLEDTPSASSQIFQPLSSSSSLESEEISSARIQRPQSSRRTSPEDSSRGLRSRNQLSAVQQQQHRVSLLRRQLSVQDPRPRRSRSLDDISSSSEGSSCLSGRRRDSRIRRPCRRRARSCSPECDWSQPLGVLTTKSDPSSLRLDSNVVLPQTPNKIRRLRSKNARFSKNIWFVGSTEKSFNSRCSKKFFIDDLDENSTHYYYFRSYPKVAPSSLSISTSSSSTLSSPSSSSSSSKLSYSSSSAKFE